MKVKSKTYSIVFILSTIFLLLLSAAKVYQVDPFFHYRGLNDDYDYPLTNGKARYQSVGLVQNEDYDALIVGTSMTENFSTDQFDQLFNVNSMKVSTAGGYYKETGELLREALENREIKHVIRGIDTMYFFIDKDAMRDDTDKEFLYNGISPDDVKYLLNKDVLFKEIPDIERQTENQWGTKTRDEYLNWDDQYEFTKEEVMSTFARRKEVKEPREATEAEIKNLIESLEENVISIAKDYPETTFHLFFPPYSVLEWDNNIRDGVFDVKMELYEIAIDKLSEIDNIELYGFDKAFEITTNLEGNYKDWIHYSEEINAYILYSIESGNHKITEENKASYLEAIREFYGNYDYDAIYQEEEK